MTTGTRARTRRAILDAAFVVLSQNSGASLADVAAAADVGRTTVHRYFPERSALIAAMIADALEQVAAATERARLGEGRALEALGRLCQEYFELGDRLSFMFSEPTVLTAEAWDEETDSDRALLELIERGHADGTIDPEAPAVWVQHLLWALLYTAWEHMRTHDASRHDALELALRALRKALAP